MNLSEKKETWDAAFRRRICRYTDGVLIPTHVNLWTVVNFLFPNNCVKHRQVCTPNSGLSLLDECGHLGGWPHLSSKDTKMAVPASGGVLAPFGNTSTGSLQTG